MTALLDTSVILASLDPDESSHEHCDRLISGGGHWINVHALSESFSILTGGRMKRRVKAAVATRLLKESVLPFVRTLTLNEKEIMSALADSEIRGVRGGAVYDYLHLIAARKANVDRLITLDSRNFLALCKPGDPEIVTV